MIIAIACAVLIVLIVIVVHETSKSPPTACPGRGSGYPCPDTWVGTDPSAPPERICNGSFQWDTNGVGPHSCHVTCPAGTFPCWDADSGQGACRPGHSAATACIASCTAVAGPNGCQNGSVCDRTTGACACVGGYFGNRCENPPDLSCANKPADFCQGGKCNISTGGPKGGQCLCPEPLFYRSSTTGKCVHGVCDIAACRAVNKLAGCADPSGPNPYDCACPDGVVGPVNAKNGVPCTVCMPNRGPPGNCHYYAHTNGTFITYAGRSDAPPGCYWSGASSDTLAADCQGEFGPAATYAGYRSRDTHCDEGLGIYNRLYCTVPEWYTTDPAASDNYDARGADGRGEANPGGLWMPP